MNSVKKVIAYVLSSFVLVFCILAILGIWNIIDMEDILSKMFQSLMVIFAASALIVIIFALLMRDHHRLDD